MPSKETLLRWKLHFTELWRPRRNACVPRRMPTEKYVSNVKDALRQDTAWDCPHIMRYVRRTLVIYTICSPFLCGGFAALDVPLFTWWRGVSTSWSQKRELCHVQVQKAHEKEDRELENWPNQVFLDTKCDISNQSRTTQGLTTRSGWVWFIRKSF